MDAVKRRVIMDSLVSGASVREAALVAGCAVPTVYNALKDQDFADELRRRQSELWNEQRAKLLSLLPTAAFVVESVLRGEEVDRARLETAQWLLEVSGCASDMRPTLPKAGRVARDIEELADELGA